MKRRKMPPERQRAVDSVASHHALLQKNLAWLRTLPSDAEAEIDNRARGNVAYLRLLRRDNERQRELDDFIAEQDPIRRLTAEHLIYVLESMLSTVENDLIAFRRTAEEPPTPIETYLGDRGHRLDVTDEVDLLAVLVDERQQERFDRQLHTAPTHVVRDRYKQAVDVLRQADDDLPPEVLPPEVIRESAALVRYVEGAFRAGWRPASTTLDQTEATKDLAKLIQTTRAERVPPEVAKGLAVIEDARRLCAKAQNEKLFAPGEALRPLNLKHRPDIDSRIIERGLQDLAAWEPATDPEPENVA